MLFAFRELIRSRASQVAQLITEEHGKVASFPPPRAHPNTTPPPLSNVARYPRRNAVERQIASGVVHTSTLYLIRSQVELAEKIARLSGIKDAKVFFTNSGTEANETALLAALTARQANEVLAMRGSYHGRSFGAVSVTGNAAWKMSSHSPFGTHYLHGATGNLPVQKPLRRQLRQGLRGGSARPAASGIHPADVGCLLAEPVQGVGGFTMPPDGLFAAYKEVLDEHGILLISDEVQTAWGRTGEHFWGISAHGIVPDAMTFAKGLGNGFAVGGVVARGELLDGIRGNGIPPSAGTRSRPRRATPPSTMCSPTTCSATPPSPAGSSSTA